MGLCGLQRNAATSYKHRASFDNLQLLPLALMVVPATALPAAWRR
jgi:hypothetical protein